jgi:hypothetical protein
METAHFITTTTLTHGILQFRVQHFTRNACGTADERTLALLQSQKSSRCDLKRCQFWHESITIGALQTSADFPQ